MRRVVGQSKGQRRRADPVQGGSALAEVWMGAGERRRGWGSSSGVSLPPRTPRCPPPLALPRPCSPNEEAHPSRRIRPPRARLSLAYSKAVLSIEVVETQSSNQGSSEAMRTPMRDGATRAIGAWRPRQATAAAVSIFSLSSLLAARPPLFLLALS
eukprot:scaffold112660_cov29-Tisochrysis_lutea.AAC.1